MTRWILAIILVCLVPAIARAAPTSADLPEGLALFEQHIRPVLVEQCYKCHSATSEKVKGKLWLDSKEGIAKGGDGGPIVVAGEPDKSRLIEAIRWTDPDLKMPPKKQLTPQQIQWFEQWVKLGTPDPRTGPAAPPAAGAVAAEKRGMDLETGRRWWAFQPVKEIAPPKIKDPGWARGKVDSFVGAKLDESGLRPSPEADRRTLIRRAYLDLTGLRPTYDEVEAFAKDDSPAAYEKLIDRLLASERYGERWGRYWLDVVRYAEDNPTGEATNPGYPFAWRYRDWVIKAVNQDVPYDRFVSLQLAADQMPGTPRQDLVALGFLGTGPVYHKDGRLSKEVIETLCNDDWDERIDTVTRGFLGMTVACARCHDHKFDPITTRDYYSLQGIFASIVQVPRPLAAEVSPEVETQFMAAQQRLFYLSYVANLLRGEPGSKPTEAREKVIRYTAEMERVLQSMAFLRNEQPQMYAQLDQLAKRPPLYPDQAAPATRPAATPVASTQPGRRRGFGAGAGAGAVGTGAAGGAAANADPNAAAAAGAAAAGGAVAGGNGRRGGRGGGSAAPFFHAVFDAGMHVNGSDPDLTMIDIRPGEPRDMNVLQGGNVARPGDVTPRRFLSVLSKDDAPFRVGSGRRELAERIFSDGAPLAARVIVNRVWAWHFGRPIVATQSDFGAQGEKPTHPELLDDLAARFIASGWSMKWLHREIMLSAAYQQASHPRDDAMRLDPTDRLLWRMAPRRLDAEAYHDCLLQAAGTLDLTAGGVSSDLDQEFNRRRTVYARIGRGRVSNMLQLFDFPSATMHSPGRETTVTPLQQLFAMNGAFMQGQAFALATSVGTMPVGDERVTVMYRKALGRDPDAAELKLAADFFAGGGTLAQYTQALLSTNEVLFWP